MKTIRSFVLLSYVSIGLLLASCVSYHSGERPATSVSTTTVERGSAPSGVKETTKKTTPPSTTTTTIVK